MTGAEVLIWNKIRNGQLLGYKFRRQYSVGIFILDFYCPKLRLAIEIDGSQHVDEEVKVYDDGRTNYLKDFNIKVLRYWNNDVLENIEGVCSDIENNIKKLKKEIQ